MPDFSKENPYSNNVFNNSDVKKGILTNKISLFTIADSYQNTFENSREDAVKMAAWTKGYPFAFQVLGFNTWEKQGDFNNAFDEAYRYLAEYSYMKIFSGLSAKDRNVVFAIASSKTNQNKEIREILGWSTNQYNPYRMRLIRKGLIDGENVNSAQKLH